MKFGIKTTRISRFQVMVSFLRFQTICVNESLKVTSGFLRSGRLIFAGPSNSKTKSSLSLAGSVCRPTRCLHKHTLGFKNTIFSLSSGHGKCGVAVIRVSGPQATDAVKLMTKAAQPPPPRLAVLQTIYHPSKKVPLDQALLLWFPGPGSFTGEDVCEFHVHGGPAVVSAVLEALSAVPGLRHAEPGEYTKRAFQNGKMDLVEVEGLADLIHAETEFQRQQALRQMEGHLSQLYTSWRSRLLKCVANTEAYIDFSEDDNIEDDVLNQVEEEIKNLSSEIKEHLSDNRRGERLRSGVRVAILGRPNVGKSSLLNAICRRPAAIVSPIAGTTRDIVETALNIAGYPVVLSDTAGLRETTDIIEMEGVSRALARAEDADIKLLVIDIPHVISQHQGDFTSLYQTHKIHLLISSHLKEIGFYLINNEADGINETVSRTISADSLIVVFNKVDLVGNERQRLLQQVKDEDAVLNEDFAYCYMSCTSGQGMDVLLELLANKVRSMCSNPSSGNPSLTQARHRSHLEDCLESLGEYHAMMATDVVLGAELLRRALRHIGKITGQVTSEEILNVIFRDFCIGK